MVIKEKNLPSLRVRVGKRYLRYQHSSDTSIQFTVEGKQLLVVSLAKRSVGYPSTLLREVVHPKKSLKSQYNSQNERFSMSIVTCFGDTMFTKQNELTSSLKFGYVFDPEAFLCIHTRNGDRREVPL